MMELSVIENDHAEVKKYLKNFVPDNYYRVLGDAYLYQVRAVLQHAVRNPGEYNARYDALINSLTSQFEDNRVNIGQQISTWADKQAVHAQRLTYLEAENSTVSAGITELEKIIISNNKAVLEKTNKLAAQLKDFEVGGVNLIQNSTFAKGYRAVGDVAITTSDHVLGTLFKIVNLADSEEEIGIGSLVEFNKIKLMEGKQYTLSFYGFGSVELLNNVKLYKGDLVHTLDPIIMDSDISNRKILTFIAPFSGDDIGFSIGTVGYPVDSWFSLVAVQLELGSRATDWSPSPFDNADYIARVAASIEEVRKITIEQQEVNVAAIDTLRANIGETKGQISNEREINLTKFTSMTRQLDELTSSTAGNTSRITNLDKTYTDKFTSNAEKLVELEANVGASNAAITKVDKVVATNTSAIATSTNKLSAKIDGIKIGGRNLIRNSTFKLGHEAWGDATITRKDTVLGSEVTITNNGSAQFGIQNDVLFRSINLVEGEEYTLSFYGNGNIPSINSIWLKSDGKDPQLLSEIAIDDVLAEKKVLTFTSTITADDISIIIAAVGYPKDSWFKIVALQLEKGNKATDWTEAPEDIVNFISGVEANIDEFKSVQVGINGATAKQIDTLNTKTDKSSAAIDELRTASSTNENAVVKLATDLRAEFKAADTKVEGVIASEKKILLDANTALAETVSKLDTRVGSNSSTISSNYKTLNDKHSSLAEVVTTIGAKTDSALSKISTAQIAIASNTSALTKNKTDITAAYTDAIAVVDGKINTRLNSLDTLVSSKADVKRVDTVENTAKQSLAETKVELLGSFTSAVNTAKDESALDAQDKADKALANATVKANQAQTAAERYALAKAELEAAKALDEAKSDATTKANLARANAELTAAQDAKNKADEALRLAKEDAAAKVKVVQDMLDALAVVVDSKASITRVDKVVNDATQALAEAKTEITGSYTTAIKTAKTASATDAQDKANKAKTAAIAEAKRLSDLAESAAKSYASTEQNLAEVRAKAYADGVVTAEELARLAQAKDNLDAAMLDSQKKANAAKQAAIEAAAADATVKANQSLSDSQALILKAVEGIEIGGRNLLLNSDFKSGSTNGFSNIYGEHSANGSYVKTYTSTNSSARLEKRFILNETGIFTYSFTIKSDISGDFRGFVDLDIIESDYYTPSEDFKRISVTFRNTVAGSKIIRLYQNVSEAGQKTEVLNEQLERGNKVTDWTLAPEDLQSNAEKLATEAKEAAQTFATTKAEAERVKAESYADGIVTAEELARIAEVDAKYKAALLDSTQKSEAAKNAAILAAATDAKTKADNALASAKTEANRLSDLALDAAKVHANAKAEAERALAEAHADGIVTIEEEERIKQANAIAEAAKLDATKKADAAKNAAVIAAAADADSKVSQAILNSKAEAVKLSNEALAAAKVYANAQAEAERLIAEAHADNIVTAEEQARIAQALQVVKDAKADATKKADAAQDAAIKAAALDATAKANAAEKAAKEYADTKADGLTTLISSKADIDVVNKIKNDTNGAIAQQKTDITADYSKAISDIEIGGRNLFRSNGSKYVTSPVKMSPFSVYTNTSWGQYAKRMQVDGDTHYMISVWVKRKTTDNTDMYIHPVQYGADGARTTAPSKSFAVTEDWSLITYPLLTASASVTMDFYMRSSTGETWISGIKVEKGNKVTDWTPAPEDIEESLAATTKLIEDESSARATAIADTLRDAKAYSNQLDDVIKGSFKDGLIDEAEAISIKAHINELNTQKNDLDQKFTTMYANTDLAGTAKTNLNNAKVALNSYYTNLVNYINSVTSNGKVTKAQSTAVSTKFTDYADALKLLSQRFEEANDSIVTKAKSDAVSSAKSYTDGVVNPLKKEVDSKASVTRVEQAEGYADRAIGESSKTITASYKKAIDDIEIGGRNLLPSSLNNIRDYQRDKWVDSANSKTTLTVKAKQWITVYFNHPDIDSELQYVLSFKMRKVSGTVSKIGGHSDPHSTGDITIDGKPVDGYWAGGVLYPNDNLTHTVSVVVTKVVKNNFIYIQVDRGNGYTNTSVVDIWDIQVERGNKATDWTPPPEDITSAIDGTIETIKRVEATANGVKAEASSIITVGGKVTGWKNLNDGTTSSFDILDDNFSVGNSTTSKKPFKIVGSDIQFNGKVSFNSVVGDVPGSRITNGTLDLNKLNSTDKSLINTASSNASSALSKAGTAQSRADSAWNKAGTAETNAKTHTDNTLKNTIYYPNSTTIDGNKIQSGTIVANKLSVNSLSALSANMGAITSGSLNINNKFIVDSSGNMTATSGKFSGDISGATGKFTGTVLANKIEGKVGNIADFAVDTLQIAGNAVTVTGVFFAEPETHFNIAQTDYIVAELDVDSAGGTVIVDYAYTSMRVYRYGAPPTLVLKILRNDELLKEREYTLNSGGTTTFPQHMFLPIVDNPPKGINKYTVVLYIKKTKESDIRVSITDRCLIVRGAKDDRK